jgi:hypothetical protein
MLKNFHATIRTISGVGQVPYPGKAVPYNNFSFATRAICIIAGMRPEISKIDIRKKLRGHFKKSG